MKKNMKILLISFLMIISVIIIILLVPKKNNSNFNKEDSFSQCLKDSNAVLYGASWCGHCKNQKEKLGNSKNIPYVECTTPDGEGQAKECLDKKIEGYPTWIFMDGSRESGELSIEKLSEKTGCPILN